MTKGMGEMIEEHTEGLPTGWSITLKSLALSPRTFTLRKNGVYVAMGKEWNSRGKEWMIVSYAHPDLRPVADAILDEFRAYKKRELEARAAEASIDAERCKQERAKAALAAVFGEGKK